MIHIIPMFAWTKRLKPALGKTISAFQSGRSLSTIVEDRVAQYLAADRLSSCREAMIGTATRRTKACAHLYRRWFSSSAPVQSDELKAAFAECLPKEQKRLKAIKTEHGSKELHSVNVGMVLGGMRGITGLLYETSLLDADEGIRFRGYTIPELQVRKHTILHTATYGALSVSLERV